MLEGLFSPIVSHIVASLVLAATLITLAYVLEDAPL